MPLRFRPHLRPMVWGGRRLGDVLGKRLPTAEPYGEAWEISDHRSHHSVVAAGPRAGSTLRALLEADPGSLLGTESQPEEDRPDREKNGAQQGVSFPWLVKFLDASDWLSVQVHPDEQAVRTLWPGEGSKTEAWFVLAAEPGSKVYAGLLPGVAEKQLRDALADSDRDPEAVGRCLHSFSPQPGDCLFLQAGTVHAVGGGVLIAEVQQTSDATFRLFDWNRRDVQGKARTLHIEESMACIDWSAGPVHPVRAANYPHPGEVASPEAVRQSLVRCRYFHLDYLRQARPFPCGGTGRLQALVVLHGRGSLRTAEGRELLHTGETVLLPARMPEVWCHPEGTLGVLLVTLPSAPQAAVSYSRAG